MRGLGSRPTSSMRCGEPVRGEAAGEPDQVQGCGLVGPVAVGAGEDDRARLRPRARGRVGVGIEGVRQDGHAGEARPGAVDLGIGLRDRPDRVGFREATLDPAHILAEQDVFEAPGPGLLGDDARVEPRFDIVGVDHDAPGGTAQLRQEVREPGVADHEQVGAPGAQLLGRGDVSAPASRPWHRACSGPAGTSATWRARRAARASRRAARQVIPSARQLRPLGRRWAAVEGEGADLGQLAERPPVGMHPEAVARDGRHRAAGGEIGDPHRQAA